MKFKFRLISSSILCIVTLFFSSSNAQDSLLVGKEIRVASGCDPTSMPDIATLTNNAFVVCWQDHSLNVLAHMYDENGRSISGRIQVNSALNTRHPEPAIAALPNGGFIICWHHYIEEEKRAELYGQRFSPDGTKTADPFLVTPPSQEQLSPYRCDVVPLANGDMVVAWQVYDADGWEHGLFAQRFTQDGERIEDTFQINAFPHGANETNVCLAPAPDSGFVATWSREWYNYNLQSFNEDVALQIFDKNGITKNDEITINRTRLYTQVTPAVGVLENGDILAGWHASEGYYNENIWTQLFDNEGHRTGLSRPLNHSQGINFFPKITTLKNGKLLLSWNYWPDVGGNGVTQRDLLGRQFDVSGKPCGDEFRINDISNLGYVHHSHRVSAFGDSGFVVTWQTGLESIYAKIYTGEPFISMEDSSSLPETYTLLQNTPNPFNEQTKIVYELSDMLSAYWVDIVIYNSLGQVVRKFRKDQQKPGRHEVFWNGSDEAGNMVSSGLYFCQIRVNGTRYHQMNKMMYMK